MASKKYIDRYYDTLKALLENDPASRDDKHRAYVYILHKQIKKYNSHHPGSYIQTAAHVIQFMVGKLPNSKKYVPSYESISRGWRQVLRDYPHLRGPGYDVRHNISEPEVRQEAREWTKNSNLPGKQSELNL